MSLVVNAGALLVGDEAEVRDTSWEADLDLFVEEINGAGPVMSTPSWPIGCCGGGCGGASTWCDCHS